MKLHPIATNRYYTLSINPEKNRAYLKIIGFWKSREVVPDYLSDWKKAVALLQRDFTLVTDASEMKTHPQELRKLHEEAQAIILQAKVLKIAEIVKDDIAEIQLDAIAKTTKLPKRTFKDVVIAEQWLDEPV